MFCSLPWAEDGARHQSAIHAPAGAAWETGPEERNAGPLVSEFLLGEIRSRPGSVWALISLLKADSFTAWCVRGFNNAGLNVRVNEQKSLRLQMINALLRRSPSPPARLSDSTLTRSHKPRYLNVIWKVLAAKMETEAQKSTFFVLYQFFQ